MTVIRPHCRIQFTAADVHFIVRVLGRSGESAMQALVKLLTDDESRDALLDDERLFRAVLESPGCLSISSQLYFYLLVRRVLLEAGIKDREVADYLAEVLSQFTRTERAAVKVPGQNTALEYFFEMLQALEKMDDFAAFHLRAHIANHALWFSGVFLERIRSRSERKGFPDVRYYEQLGRTNFRVASDHRLARRHNLASIFETLAERFVEARLALNQLADRLVSLGDTEPAVERLLVKASG